MGSDAKIYILDAAVFTQQVAPFIRNIIRNGAVDNAFEPHMARIRPFVPVIRRWMMQDPVRVLKSTDLDEHCTYLRADLGLLPQYEPVAETNDWPEWPVRACKSVVCPARHTCPFHVSDGAHQAETIDELFANLVRVTCLGESQFLGRSLTVFDYAYILEKNAIPFDSELWHLLRTLGTRGYTSGYMFSNSDGIHGWLLADETAALASLLAGVPLPQFKPTFGAMRRRTGLFYRFLIRGWDFAELGLAFIRTVATIGAQEGRGILWGNDLSEWMAKYAEAPAS